MKRTALLKLATLSGLLCFSQAMAQSPQLLPSDTASHALSPAEEEDWKKIREIKDHYLEGVKTGNFDSLEPSVASDFTGVMLTGEEVTGVVGLKEYTRKMQELVGPGSTHEVSLKYQPGFMLGDVAVGWGTTDEVVVTSKQNRFEYHTLWTAVLRRENGAWKIFRLQNSMNPLNNNIVKHYASQEIRLYSLLALGGGLLLGILIGRRTKRA